MRRKSGRMRDEFLFGRSCERDTRATWRIYVDRASCNGQSRAESNPIYRIATDCATRKNCSHFTRSRGKCLRLHGLKFLADETYQRFHVHVRKIVFVGEIKGFRVRLPGTGVHARLLQVRILTNRQTRSHCTCNTVIHYRIVDRNDTTYLLNCPKSFFHFIR